MDSFSYVLNKTIRYVSSPQLWACSDHTRGAAGQPGPLTLCTCKHKRFDLIVFAHISHSNSELVHLRPASIPPTISFLPPCTTSWWDTECSPTPTVPHVLCFQSFLCSRRLSEFLIRASQKPKSMKNYRTRVQRLLPVPHGWLMTDRR